MKALVTGATGFVGGHLVKSLAQRGDVVVAPARRPQAHAALAALGATPVSGSLEDRAALVTALAGVEVVYHLAGLTAAKDEAEFQAVNAGGTETLIAAVREAAPGLARFVYVSSQAALGPSPAGTPLTEDAECRPVTAYGRSKLRGEQVTRASGLPWTIVRPPSVYGPGDREFFRLFQIARWGVAPVFGTGAQQLSLVFVRDLVSAIVAAGTAASAGGEIFHAAHAEVVLSRDVARAAGTALGRSPVVLPVPTLLATPIVAAIGAAAAASGRRSVVNLDKMAEFTAPSWLLSSAKAERLLGWRAATGMDAGMRETAAWYRDKKWL